MSDPLSKDPSETLLTERNHEVQAFTADRPDRRRRRSKAASTAASMSVAGDVEIGIRRSIGAWSAEPFASFDAARLNEDTIVEHGAGSISLSAEDVHAAWVRGGAGVRMSERASRSWVAHEQVRYAHAFASEAGAMNASVGDAPQSVMAIRSDAVAQNPMQLALESSARLHSRVILTVDYHSRVDQDCANAA